MKYRVIYCIIIPYTHTLLRVCAPDPYGFGAPFNMKKKVKVRIYVDFLNYFWGVARAYGLYWVNIEKLFLDLIKTKIPNAEVEQIIIFNAMLKGRLANFQSTYLKALKSQSKNLLIVKGYHKSVRKRGKLVENGKVTKKTGQIQFYEEKKTDVNIGTYIMKDAYEENDKFGIAAIVSNDSDLATPLYFKRKKRQSIFLILPRPTPSKRFPAKKIPRELRILSSPQIRIPFIAKERLKSRPLPNKAGKFNNPGDDKWFKKKSKKYNN